MLSVAEPDVERHQRAENRQRHRHHDDEGIAEAFELGGQHQVDDDDGEAEGERDGVAFLDLKSRLASEVS